MNGTTVWKWQSTAISTALWLPRIAISGFLLLSGFARLGGVQEMVQLYQAIGLGEWLRYLTGAVEVVAAIFIVIPSRNGIGVLLATAIMAADTAEHIFVLGRIPGLPAVLFAVALIVIYVTRHRLIANGRSYPGLGTLEGGSDAGDKA
jgi:putative oxidoreductase